MNGHFHHRNPTTDTKQKILKVVAAIVEDVADGSLVGAYAHTMHEVPILFIHAGVSANFYKYMQRELASSSTSVTATTAATELSPLAIAAYSNDLPKTHLAQCSSFPCKDFEHEFFEAGPDRGGAGIGGPL